MITPERVYKIFGITDDTWWEELSLRPKYIRALPVIKASPEMLVALVHELEQLWHDGAEDETGNYIPMVKAIESADSKGRPWSEILKELLK